MKKTIERYQKWIVGVILVFMALVSVLNAKNDSAIYDEVAHIPAGYSYLKEHDMRLNPEHPPLLKNLAALPLLFFNPKFDTTQDFWTKDDADSSQWNAGRQFLYNSGNDADQIIFWSRIPIIILSLILGWFIFWWVKKLAGTLAGIFALTLYAFDPNVLGHNHFVTTDIGIAAFIAFAFYFFLKFLQNPTWQNVGLAGLFLGLVQLAKFSSVLIFPVLGLALIIYPLVLNKKENESRMRILGDYILKGFSAFVLSLILVWIAYYFNNRNMPQSKLPEIINYYFHAYDTRAINVYARNVLFYMNDQPVLAPLAGYLFGVARVFQRVAGGNVTYFMGNVSSKASASYFPLVFLMKETLAIIALAFLAVFVSLRRSLSAAKILLNEKIGRTFHEIKNYFRSNITEFSLLLFVILYSAISISGNLNIGIRHLLPIFPFIYILISLSASRWAEKCNSKIKPLAYGLILVLMLFHVSSTLSTYPNYTSYFNQVVGGPKEGYRYVTDSNADWGQDLKRLKGYLDNNPGIDKIRLDYFGGGNAQHYIGEKYISWWGARRPVEPGWYAISATLLQESLHDKSKASKETYRWIIEKGLRPIKQVGTSIFIYHLSEEDLAK